MSSSSTPLHNCHCRASPLAQADHADSPFTSVDSGYEADLEWDYEREENLPSEDSSSAFPSCRAPSSTREPTRPGRYQSHYPAHMHLSAGPTLLLAGLENDASGQDTESESEDSINSESEMEPFDDSEDDVEQQLRHREESEEDLQSDGAQNQVDSESGLDEWVDGHCAEQPLLHPALDYPIGSIDEWYPPRGHVMPTAPSTSLPT